MLLAGEDQDQDDPDASDDWRGDVPGVDEFRTEHVVSLQRGRGGMVISLWA